MPLEPVHTAGLVEAGCDEAGRGCLAGPVVAAAVVLAEGCEKEEWFAMLNDSKQLTEKKRELLRPLIIRNAAAYGIAEVSPQKIDEVNILNASILAMHRALEKAERMLGERRIEHIIVDGNRFRPYGNIPSDTIVKGDSRFASIAAASILAKTERDYIMTALDKDFPQYNWAKNKAYPTKDHRDAIGKFGATPHHRMSFRLLPDPVLF